MLTRILLGTGDPDLAARLERLLRDGALTPVRSHDPDDLWDALTREDFDVVVLERALLPDAPRDLLDAILSIPEPPGVIVLTRDEDPRERAELISGGALGVLWLGLDDEDLAGALAALTRRTSGDVLGRLREPGGGGRASLDDFVSRSPTMQRFLQLARRVVPGDSALLILGETGVGKERLARSIHAESRRSAGPFISVHCAALPEALLESELFGHEKGAFTGAVRSRRGFFELAHEGTIFLDEIGEMPLHLQVKLLRALEDRRIYRVGSESPVEIDVRIMAATNRDLKAEMAAERFRPDLYYRLAVVTLQVPPLRERLEDVPELAAAFLERSRRKLGREVVGFAPEARDALLRHDWPGNVRELINVVERAALLARGREIGLPDLRGGDSWTSESAVAGAARAEPARTESVAHRPFAEVRDEVLGDFERRYLEDLLRATGGRIGESARRAGLNERTLYGMMRRHGLRKEDFRGASRSGSR